MLRQALKLLILSLFAASAVSCASAARHGMPLSSAYLYDSIKTFVDSSETKTVVLIPMFHVAKPAHYKKINDYLDTLKSHGYVTFGEGCMPSDRFTDTLDIPLYRDVGDLYSPVDSMKLDTLYRKMRKIMGHDIDSQHDRIASRWNRTTQVSVMQMYGDRDYWVDETYADLIKDFETRYGEIELSSYDFECSIDSEKYKGKEDKRWVSVRSNNDSYCSIRIARCIFESSFDKIAVVYGYSHTHRLYWFVLPEKGYKLVDNPYYQ